MAQKPNGKYDREAVFMPSTVNEDARTIDVMWSSGAAVLRMFDDGTLFNEELEVSEKACNLGRLNNGAPVLMDHEANVKEQYAVVERAWIVGNEAYATLCFADDDEATVYWNRIKKGIIRKLSCGYAVKKWTAIKPAKDGDPITYRAVDWEPFEISFVSIPADDTTNTRSNPDVGGAEDNSFQVSETVKIEDTMSVEVPGANPPAADNTVALQNAAVESTTAERNRVKEINALTRTGKIDAAFADEHIEKGTPIDEFRKLAIEKMVATDPGNGSNSAAPAVRGDDTQKFRRDMANAIVMRVVSGAAALEYPAEYSQVQTVRQLANVVAHRHGINTSMMSPYELFKAVTRSGGMVSADFTGVLDNVANNALITGYSLEDRTFLPFCSRQDAPDFNEQTRSAIGEGGGMQSVSESGEFQQIAAGSAAEKYSVTKHGGIISLTFEMMVNDKLGAFTAMLSNQGLVWGQKQSDVVYSILTGNPVMSDGVALFHADHGNLMSGSAISPTTVGLAKAAMRKQTGIDGAKLNLTPKFLIVGPDKEQEALAVCQGTIVPNTVASVNMFAGQLTPIVDSRISGNKWFLSADPNRISTIEYGFLIGQPELSVEMFENYINDRIDYRLRGVFGAKALSHRGLIYNPGN